MEKQSKDYKKKTNELVDEDIQSEVMSYMTFGTVKGKFKETEIGMIPEDWEMIELDKLFNISAGGDLKKLSFSKTKSEEYKHPIYSNSLNNKGLYGFSKTYQYEPECVTVTGRGDVGTAECRKDLDRKSVV